MRGLWEEVCALQPGSHFREVYRNGRNRAIHDLEQEQDQHHEEDHIDKVNKILLFSITNSQQT